MLIIAYYGSLEKVKMLARGYKSQYNKNGLLCYSFNFLRNIYGLYSRENKTKTCK